MAVRAAELRAEPLCCFSGTAAPLAAAGGSQPGMPCTDLGSRSLHPRSVHCGLPAARPFGGTELHGHRASARTTGPTGRGAAGGGARRVPARPAWAAAPLPSGSVAARFPSALLWPGGSRCRCDVAFPSIAAAVAPSPEEAALDRCGDEGGAGPRGSNSPLWPGAARGGEDGARPVATRREPTRHAAPPAPPKCSWGGFGGSSGGRGAVSPVLQGGGLVGFSASVRAFLPPVGALSGARGLCPPPKLPPHPTAANGGASGGQSRGSSRLVRRNNSALIITAPRPRPRAAIGAVRIWAAFPVTPPTVPRFPVPTPR